MKYLNFILSILMVLSGPISHAQLMPVSEQLIEKQYITNGGFENAKAGWAVYKNTAQALPVSGTGGSPSLTLAASTSSPLSGKSSGVITKSAANLQGEGISYAFTVEPADKGKSLSISGVYQIVSGTYSGGTSTTDSDLEAYVYDVDAAQIIQPAGYKLDGSVTGNSYPISASFQTSVSSTNYRLIFHVATTSSSAYSIKLDKIKVSAQPKSQGTVATDLSTLYTVTPSNGFTVSTNKIITSRFADRLIIDGSFTYSATAANTASISFPLNIDTSKLGTATNGKSVGWWATTQNADVRAMGSSAAGFLMFDGTNTGQLFFVTNSGGTAGQWTKANASTLMTNFSGGVVSLHAEIPIQGWGSTVTMSDSSETRVVGAIADGTGLSIPNNTATVINFSSVSSDTHGSVTTGASWKFTAPVPGFYEVSGFLGLNSGTSFAAGTVAAIDLYKNGVSYKSVGGTIIQATTGSAHRYPYTGTVYLNSGEYVDVRLNQNSGNTVTAFGYVNIFKKSGPSQIAASESVYATYIASASQSVAGNVQLNFDTKVADSHSAVTTGAGSWKFTAPVSGKYQVTVNTDTTTNFLIKLYKSGTFAYYIGGNASGLNHGIAAFTIPLNASEYIDVRPSTSATLNGSANGETNISITRVGN